MIDSIKKEIQLTAVYPESQNIDTIYFGGGTPSVLSVKDLQLLLETIHYKFNVSAGAEITLEANPDDITLPLLEQWQLTGINRLSVGIQSFSDNELKWMNRIHNAKESLQCIDHIISSGYKNFSVDLIYGSPLSDNDQLKKNLDTIYQKSIPHISCYALTVEPKTILDSMIAKNKSLPVDPQIQSEQFLLVMDYMQNNGYEHYEISNFSKPGMRSRHNSSYWQGKSYYGFGPSAHSYDGNKIRKWNVSNNSLYIQSIQKNLVPFSEELLTDVQQINEYIMISLRTIEGIDLRKIDRTFGETYSSKIIQSAEVYKKRGYVKISDHVIVLTNEGKLFADGIASDLFTT